MKKILPIVIALAAVAGCSFFGGMKFAESKGSLAGFSQRQGNFQRMGNGTSTARSGFVSGEIMNKDDSSLTVKLRDGGSKIVFFSEASVITKSASGTISDLEAGKQITVSGKTNDDGSVTAQSIQIGSMIAGGQFPGVPQQ